MALNLLLALAISLATVAPQSTTDERDSLIGIPGVRVLIENLSADALATGLSADQLKTDVELKLRLAGIKVISLPINGLYVQITYLKAETVQGEIGFSCYVEVSFRQPATLSVNQKLVMASVVSNK
jgi:hypothetical protein